MTDEEKRSCFTCEHQSLCHPKLLIHHAINKEAGWMFEDAPRPWTEVFDTLAEACNHYEEMKGAESK